MLQGMRAGCKRSARLCVATVAVLWLAACSSYGSSFDSQGLTLMTPGITTRAQAEDYLRGPAFNTYHQQDGSQIAIWLKRSTLATDAVYIQQELWLQFDAQQRLVRVLKRENIPGIYQEQAAIEPDTVYRPVGGETPVNMAYPVSTD